LQRYCNSECYTERNLMNLFVCLFAEKEMPSVHEIYSCLDYTTQNTLSLLYVKGSVGLEWIFMKASCQKVNPNARNGKLFSYMINATSTHTIPMFHNLSAVDTAPILAVLFRSEEVILGRTLLSHCGCFRILFDCSQARPCILRFCFTLLYSTLGLVDIGTRTAIRLVYVHVLTKI
jgi:hypothetical protein